jgi:3-oxoacyl-[acyl-carrier protein] reductase
MGDVFFLTGCASGIGRHMTEVLRRRGNRVFATDLDEAALSRVAEELGWPPETVRTARLDVTDYAAWEAVFAEAVDCFGGVDVTMNIAGLLLSSWAEETPRKEIDGQVDVNIKGVIYGTRVSAAHMAARGHGHIINIASIAGLTPVPGMAVYCATKYAVRAYSISAAMELRPKGVYVTAFCPATVQTPMLDNQEGVDAAELFFSGLRILTLADIEKAMLKRALPKKPLEVHVPRFKLWYTHLLDQMPGLGPLIAPVYQWSGRRRQRQRRQQ